MPMPACVRATSRASAKPFIEPVISTSVMSAAVLSRAASSSTASSALTAPKTR
jgi:hypothetical protein